MINMVIDFAMLDEDGPGRGCLADFGEVVIILGCGDEAECKSNFASDLGMDEGMEFVG